MLTNFLIKTFVKDYKKTKNTSVRKRYGYLSGTVGIACNAMLFLLKLFIGLYLNSIAVMADAFNNLSDIASAVVAIFGFEMSGKPADKEHPFGHGRFEYIAAMVVAFMVLLVAFEFAKGSVKRIINPNIIEFDLLTFILLSISILLKIWLALFYKSIGKTIDSKVMEATALDSTSDVIATSVVALSLLAGKYTTIAIDGYIGLLVSLFIFYNAISLIKDTLGPLLGEAPDEELVKAINSKILSYGEILGVHDLIVHNYGHGRTVASICAEIPCSLNLTEAHNIIDTVEREISESLGIHLVIHIDPVDIGDKAMIKAQKNIINILEEFPYDLSIHDFYIEEKGDCLNIVFDMVVPFNFKIEDEDKLIEAAKIEIEKRHPGYNVTIKIDHQYSIME